MSDIEEEFNKLAKKHKEKNKKIKKKDELATMTYVDVERYKKDKRQIVKEGRKIYKENDYISKIWDIMSDKTFSEFFDSYLYNYNDLQVAMVFFHVYKNIKEQYNKIFGHDISKEEMVYLLKHVMSNNFMRKYMIQSAKDDNKIHLNNDILTQDMFTLLDNHKNGLLSLE